GAGFRRARAFAFGRAHPVLADLVDRDDVRMIERGGRLGFADEPPNPIFAPHQLGREDLEGHAPLEGLVLREVDLAHASRSERADDAVVRDLILRLKGAGRSHSRGFYPQRMSLRGTICRGLPGGRYRGPGAEEVVRPVRADLPDAMARVGRILDIGPVPRALEPRLDNGRTRLVPVGDVLSHGRVADSGGG